MSVLVVGQLRMFAVDETHAVLWACFDRYHAAFTDFLEEFLGQGPRARVVVGGQEQKQQLVHAFSGCIGHLHKRRNVDNILNILGYCEDDLIFDHIILGVYV